MQTMPSFVTNRIKDEHLAQEVYGLVVGLRGQVVERAQGRGLTGPPLHMHSSALTGVTRVFGLGSAQQVSDEFQLKRICINNCQIMLKIWSQIPVELESGPGIKSFGPEVQRKCNRRTKCRWMMCNVEHPSGVQVPYNTELPLLESSTLKRRFRRLALNRNHRSNTEKD